MISFAGSRRIHGQWSSSIPSRFIEELPSDVTLISTSQGEHAREVSAYKPESLHAVNSIKTGMPLRPGIHARQTGSSPAGHKPVNTGGTFNVSDRVFHQKFGYGEIMVVEGDKLEIEFDKAGAKMVMATFISLAD